MDLYDANMLALHLMNVHNLIKRGWTLKWGNAKRQHGSCRGRKKIITLSRIYAASNSEPEFRNVVLHEIAHALDFEKRGKSDHGPEWKALAWAIGCTAERTQKSLAAPTYKWKAVCPNPACGKSWGVHRRRRKPSACAECCKKYNGGKYDARFVLRYVPNN